MPSSPRWPTSRPARIGSRNGTSHLAATPSRAPRQTRLVGDRREGQRLSAHSMGSRQAGDILDLALFRILEGEGQLVPSKGRDAHAGGRLSCARPAPSPRLPTPRSSRCRALRLTSPFSPASLSQKCHAILMIEQVTSKLPGPNSGAADLAPKKPVLPHTSSSVPIRASQRVGMWRSLPTTGHFISFVGRARAI
jgi:hypothetical protein